MWVESILKCFISTGNPRIRFCYGIGDAHYIPSCIISTVMMTFTILCESEAWNAWSVWEIDALLPLPRHAWVHFCCRSACLFNHPSERRTLFKLNHCFQISLWRFISDHCLSQTFAFKGEVSYFCATSVNQLNVTKYILFKYFCISFYVFILFLQFFKIVLVK